MQNRIAWTSIHERGLLTDILLAKVASDRPTVLGRGFHTGFVPVEIARSLAVTNPTRGQPWNGIKSHPGSSHPGSALERDRQGYGACCINLVRIWLSQNCGKIGIIMEGEPSITGHFGEYVEGNISDAGFVRQPHVEGNISDAGFVRQPPATASILREIRVLGTHHRSTGGV